MSAYLLEKVIAAADQLEALAFAFNSARLRLEIARRHVEHGDRDSAVRQLNHAFEVLTRLDATNEIEQARLHLREPSANIWKTPVEKWTLITGTRQPKSRAADS